MSGDQRVSTFPLPPMQYVNCYPSDRVQAGTAPQPPPPLDSNYLSFGVQCTKEDAVIHSLESQGLRRLYPPLYDHKRELKKLNFSILANYLDLVDLMIKAPDSPERGQKLEHMKILFINMHHLVNEYRPLQARDTLQEMLQHQGSVTRQTVDTAAKYLAKVDAIIAGAAAELMLPGQQQRQHHQRDAADLLAELGLDHLLLAPSSAGAGALTAAADVDEYNVADIGGDDDDEEEEEDEEAGVDDGGEAAGGGYVNNHGSGGDNGGDEEDGGDEEMEEAETLDNDYDGGGGGEDSRAAAEVDDELDSLLL